MSPSLPDVAIFCASWNSGDDCGAACPPADALRAPHRVAHGEAVLDLVAHRLFDVDVLARFHRVDHHPRVPVVGRRDDHRVDRFVVEQSAVVAVGLGAGRGGLQARFEIRPVDVADRRHLRADLLELRRQQLPASASADRPDPHGVGSTHGPGRRRGRDEKTSPVHTAVSLCHGRTPVLGRR